MSNALFDPGREGFALGEIDWDTGVFKAALVRGYTFDASDKFVSDAVSGGATIAATSSAIGSKTGTSGVLNSGVWDFGNVSAGAACTAILLFQSSAVTGGADVATSAQRLVAYIDTLASGALNVVPNGGQITWTPDTGVNKILKL